MRSRNILFCVSLSMLFVSCSPKISVLVLKSYPPLQPNDTVTVYFQGKQVPKRAEPLAKVSVYDGGLTVNCNYDRVMGIAKNETRKVGGNGLLITDHRLPSIWGSSCHQIEVQH